MKIEEVVEKPFKEVLEYPKFDFLKPVKKQRRILMPLVWLLSLPETFKRKLKITKVNMDSLKKNHIYLLIIIIHFMILKLPQEQSFLKELLM